MQRSKLVWVILFCNILALLFPISSLADAAPPDVPDGENINPGEGTTMVQMVAEEVIIDVGLTHEVLYINDYGDYLEGYTVAYNCTFWLVNQGTETENLAVRFPIRSDFEFGTINILSIKVNYQPTPWVEDENTTFYIDGFQWAHFDVLFPPGEEVEVQVTYTSITRGWPGNPRQILSYILETGAGWYGPIEHGRIILRLPYKTTSENVILAYTNTSEGIFNNSDVYWEFSNLEPTSDDNWKVGIIEPDLWLQILAERNRLADFSE